MDMTSNTALILILVCSSLYIDSTEAGWKFWKKDKKDETTTTTTTTVAPAAINSDAGGAINKAIASAADPGLVVGVGSTGSDVKTNARPQQPNPGTEVGQDVLNSAAKRPGTPGKDGYRDWAIQLTGAGEPSGPVVPKPSPAVNPQSPQPAGNPPKQQPPTIPTVASTSARPTLPVNNAGTTAGQGQRPPAVNVATQRPPAPTTASTTTSTQKPSTPRQTPAPTSTTQKPTTGKTWAQIAGGNSRPSALPTPVPRPAQPTTARPNSGAVAGAAAIGTVAVGNAAKKVYTSNPTYSKGTKITDEDLEKLFEALYIKDTSNGNNAWKHITVNLQKKTTPSSPVDEAPQPLLTVNPAALQIPTIEKLIKLYDNYQLDSRTAEYISPAQRTEESQLVDTFLSTNVMSAAMRFLADKSIVAKDYYTYKEILRRIWFTLYSRGHGRIGSAGFEHVFLTELKLGTEVSGLHNWVYFNAEEVKKRADYLGYMKKLDLGDKAAILKFHVKFNNIDKPVTTMFIGTSPELEMAIYTVCFLARPDQTCPVSLGGTKFNVITHKFRYGGKDLIGSAYPEI